MATGRWRKRAVWGRARIGRASDAPTAPAVSSDSLRRIGEARGADLEPAAIAQAGAIACGESVIRGGAEASQRFGERRSLTDSHEGTGPGGSSTTTAIPKAPPCTPSSSWNCLIPGRPGTWQRNSQPLVPAAHLLTVIFCRCIEYRTSSGVMRGHRPQAYRAFAKGNPATGQNRMRRATHINIDPPSRRRASLFMRLNHQAQTPRQS